MLDPPRAARRGRRRARNGGRESFLASSRRDFAAALQIEAGRPCSRWPERREAVLVEAAGEEGDAPAPHRAGHVPLRCTAGEICASELLSTASCPCAGRRWGAKVVSEGGGGRSRSSSAARLRAGKPAAEHERRRGSGEDDAGAWTGGRVRSAAAAVAAGVGREVRQLRPAVPDRCGGPSFLQGPAATGQNDGSS